MNQSPTIRRILQIAVAVLLPACGSGSTGSTGSSATAGTTGGSSAGTTGTAGVEAAGGGGSAAGSQGAPSGGSGAGATSGSAGAGSGGTTGGSGGGISATGGGAGATMGSGGTTAGSSGAAASSCTKSNAACVASNTGCNVSTYYFYDNQWNCGPQSGNHCGPESGYACANGDGTIDFAVTSNQPAGNTAVLTYPAIQSNFSGKPLLSSFKSITSTFSETGPGPVGDYEVAWDCWFNGLANEIMVWVDTYKQVPGGKKVASAVALGGGTWDVWQGSGGYLAFKSTSTMISGTVELLQLFNYAATNGWLPTTSVVSQLAFGIEVCSTDGKDANWTIEKYSLTAN
jgi:hypothetical protein